MRAWYTPAFFVACLCFGLWVNDYSWNGQLYVYVGEQRAPAAVRSISEYSSLDRETLSRSVQAQLFAYAQIYKDNGLLGLQLGHPLLNGTGGGKEFACQVQDHSGTYDRVEVTFVGTGITEHGETPQMIVDAKCRSEHDLNQLETVWIPMQTVMASQPRDQEFDFAGEDLLKLSFRSTPSQWPENWVMWSVRFYREDDPAQALVLDTAALKQARPELLSFDWKAGE